MQLIIAPSQGGKTQLFFKSLEDVEANYNPKPAAVYFLYNTHQTLFDEMAVKLESQGVKAAFNQGSHVTENDLRTLSEVSGGGQIILAIDDATVETSKDSQLAQNICVSRHYNVSIVLFWHSLFSPNPASRLISANCRYIFLLASPRILGQVGTLGTQLQMRSVLVSAFKEESKQPYGFVLVDLNATTPHNLRIRSGLFRNDRFQRVYHE